MEDVGQAVARLRQMADDQPVSTKGRRRLRRGFQVAGLIIAGVVGWFLLTAAYLTAYNLIEGDAIPVEAPTRDFGASSWDAGYFRATGSYQNDSAKNDGEELLTQADDITCVKSSNTCTVSIADVYDHFLHLDVTPNDIDSWTDKQITFHDDSSICAVSTTVIDRVSQTVSLIVRKKAQIPDYAVKSPLHPCDGNLDKNITLGDGLKANFRARERFEQRNGLYFHLALAALNVTYFYLIWLCWRRFRRTA